MKNGEGNAILGTMSSASGRHDGATSCGLRRNGAGKRVGPVEAAIAWAFCEELPKVPRADGPLPMAGGWDRTGRYAELLSLVDLYGVNRYGVVPDFAADRWPSPDAIAIADAVAGLDEAELELPEDWRPAPELDGFGGLGAMAVSAAWRRMTRTDGGRQVLRIRPSHLVIRAAVLGPRLDAMELCGVAERFEAHGNGEAKWFVERTVDVVVGAWPDGSDRTEARTVEQNGWNSRQRRPMPDAYRKTYLDPDPVPTIIARAEHEIWLSALEMVHADLTGKLETVELLPSTVPPAPWIDRPATARILPDLVIERHLKEEANAARRDAFRARFPRWFANLRRLADEGEPAVDMRP